MVNHTPPFAVLQSTTSFVTLRQYPANINFSAGGEVATKQQAQLGVERFENLVMMKSAWNNNIRDFADQNSKKVEEVNETIDNELIVEYKDMPIANWDFEEWDKMVEDELPVILDI